MRMTGQAFLIWRWISLSHHYVYRSYHRLSADEIALVGSAIMQVRAKVRLETPCKSSQAFKIAKGVNYFARGLFNFTRKLVVEITKEHKSSKSSSGVDSSSL